MVSQKVFSQAAYLTAVNDPNGNTTRVTYDSSNRINQVTDAGGRSLTFTYGDNSNPNQVTRISDGVGIVASYVYDSTSHLLQVQYPDATTNSYVYDSAGLLTRVVDNEAKLVRYLPCGAVTFYGKRFEGGPIEIRAECSPEGFDASTGTFKPAISKL